MSKSKIIISIIVLLCISFAVFQFKDNQFLSDLSRAFIVTSFTVLYFINYKPTLCCFTAFLVLFTTSELISVFADFFPFQYYRAFYFIVNGIYILAYLMLSIEILRHLKLNTIFKNFSIHLVTLTGLNLYLLYVLHNIIVPYIEINLEFILELTYNITILTLLSIALINYLYRDNKKSLLIFMGVLCVFFSEVIQFAYLYITTKTVLDIVYTILLVTAFLFLYLQTKFDNNEVPLMVQKEAL